MNKENKLDKYLLIVSKSNPLNEEKDEWIKENFEFVPYTDEDGESCMEVETFRAYTALVALMKKKYHLDVNSHSAYRSIERQQQVYDQMVKLYGEEWAKGHVATPGTSEHHTGLAFDLRFKSSFVPEFLRGTANKISKRTGYQKKFFEILEKEAVQFGLVKRYKAGKEDITGFKEEAWHFRYVGVEHAKKMYETGMCLEEYTKELILNNQNAKVALH